MLKMLKRRPEQSALLVTLALACGGESQPPGSMDMAGAMVFPVPGATCTPPTGELAACTCSPLDYAPRDRMSQSDAWPACTSDQGTFKLLGASSPAAAARTGAFTAMAPRLWKNAAAPTKDDFLQARTDYAQAQGLGSRVARRQDIHYPEVPGGDKFACNDSATAMMYPLRCAGPGQLQPIINDAFALGQAGTAPRLQAARIEAALLWFFYLSVLSEVWTSSFDKLEDIDSMWGYYNGAEPREAAIGLAGYIKALSPATHDRVFDGLLGGRCWRDLDPALPSKRLDMYQAVSQQLDRALLRGMALILRDRLGQLGQGTAEERAAHLGFVQLLGERMDRAARAVSAAQADVLKQQVAAASPDQVDVKAAQAALDALFPCA